MSCRKSENSDGQVKITLDLFHVQMRNLAYFCHCKNKCLVYSQWLSANVGEANYLISSNKTENENYNNFIDGIWINQEYIYIYIYEELFPKRAKWNSKKKKSFPCNTKIRDYALLKNYSQNIYM